MVGLQSFQSYPQARFALRDKKHAVSEEHTPRQNQLLAMLPEVDYARLLPALEHVPLALGVTVYGAGDWQRQLYFITAGIVTQFYLTDSGASAGFAVAGCEGVVGVASFLGGESMPSGAMVLSAGYAYRLVGIRLRREFEHGGPLLHLLLRYTHALIAQTTLTVACNRYHSVKQQLCRWLLLSLDRLPSNDVTMTQEFGEGLAQPELT
jgi:CRP-like cAMP-binding protein